MKGSHSLLFLLCPADALGMNTSGFSEFPAFLALRHRPSFLLDLKQRAIVVLTTRRTVTFDAGLAIAQSAP